MAGVLSGNGPAVPRSVSSVAMSAVGSALVIAQGLWDPVGLWCMGHDASAPSGHTQVPAVLTAPSAEANIDR